MDILNGLLKVFQLFVLFAVCKGDAGIISAPGVFATSYHHSCAILVNSSLSCWGYNFFGQLGLGLPATSVGSPSDFTSMDTLPLVKLDGQASWVATGEYHTCVVLGDGNVKCFGDNYYGQLGYGLGDVIIGKTEKDMNELRPLNFMGRQATQVSAGEHHTCVLFTDGLVSCFGRAADGRLGYEDEVTRGLDTATSGETIDLGSDFFVQSIASGGRHNCALSVSNQVKCWGKNDYGQLGIGSTEPMIGASPGQMGDNLPVLDLGVSTKIKQLTLGESHTCAVFEDGTVRCWGRGEGCENGVPCKNIGRWPLQMGAGLKTLNVDGDEIIHACAGIKYTCLLYNDTLNDDRLLKCFGDGERGGEGYTSDPDFLPVALSNAPSIKLGGEPQGVFCGLAHICSVLVTGDVLCWGENMYGQFGTAVNTGWNLASGAQTVRLSAIVKGGTPPHPTRQPTFLPTTLKPTSSPTRSPTSSPTLHDVTLCGVLYKSYTNEISEANFACSSLPTQLGRMTALTKLALSRQRLTGSIPTEFGKLTSLQEMFLNGNNIDGTLPSELGQLQSLKILRVFKNSLDGSVPSQLGNLDQLTELTLSSNSLSGDVPSELGQLTQIRHLHLADNDEILSLPTDLGKLAVLESLDIGEVCDCRIAGVLKTLGLSAADKAAAAMCNGAPTVGLSATDEVPCSAVTISAVANVTARSIIVDWTYPDKAELQSFSNHFDFDTHIGNFFATALDKLVGISSRIEPSEARRMFGDCRAVYTTFDNVNTDPVSIWGFQYVLTNLETGESIKKCYFARDDRITRLSSSNGEASFRLLVDLIPGEQFELRLRPFTVVIRPSALLNYQFGPVSNFRVVTALDDIPDGEIVGFTVKSREDDRLILEWLEPLVPNGIIARYLVLASDHVYPPRSASSLSPIEGKSANPTVTITELAPDTTYEISVYAETVAGSGPVFATNVSTCRLNLIAEAGHECVSRRGFFLDKGGLPVSCSDFKESIETKDCEKRDLHISSVRVMPGYWRPSNDSLDIRVCPLGPTACLGGASISGMTCGPSYEGPMCSLCSDGYFNNGGICEECSGPSIGSFALLIALVTSILVIGALAYSFKGRSIMGKGVPASLALKLQVLLPTYQIVATFSWTLGTAFPATYAEILKILLLFSFDISDLVPALGCIYRSNYLVELVVISILPIIVFALPAVVYGYWHKLTKGCSDEELIKKRKTRAFQVLIIATFVVYTPVTSKIFRALRPCDKFPDIEKSYMPEDYRIECSTGEYAVVLAVAYSMMGVYCIGVPCFYFSILWPKREEIRDQCYLIGLGDDRSAADDAKLKDLEEKHKAEQFLYRSYKYWWWELVEILRKIVLAGMIALVAPGTAEQSIILMLLALGSTVLYHHFMPFQEANLLGLVAAYTIFFAAFASLIVKFAQRFLDSALFDAVLVIIVCCPLLFGFMFTEDFLRAASRGCYMPSNSFGRPMDTQKPVESIHPVEKIM